MWRDPDDVPHCRILSPHKTKWQLISATLCGWRCCFVADQLWFMTCIREEEDYRIWLICVLVLCAEPLYSVHYGSLCVSSKQICIAHHCTASNVATAERSWPTSCSSLASYHSCYQCNRWWLLSAGSDGYIRLQTGDNTFGVPMAVLCWHQLWSDTDSNRRPYLYLNIFFYVKLEYLRAGRDGSGEDVNAAVKSTVYIVFYSNYGSIWLSFKIWLQDGQWTTGRLKVGWKKVSNDKWNEIFSASASDSF